MFRMSISSLVTSTQSLRLLDSPWVTKDFSLSPAALKKAKNTVDAWEKKYGNRLVRHQSPNHVPEIVTYEKIEAEMITPMITLGGNFDN